MATDVMPEDFGADLTIICPICTAEVGYNEVEATEDGRCLCPVCDFISEPDDWFDPS